MTDQQVRRRALATLLTNWRGASTVPAPEQYPHQWSWDSAFAAIGWAQVSTRRAWTELNSLFGGQWADGRVPIIVFSRAVPEDAYFPGPAFWRPLPSSGPVRGVMTNGLVQPAVHALAAEAVAQRANPAEARPALRRLYPRLAAWHDYLFERRSVQHGLVAVVHPWETGLDNSPAWDGALAAVPADTEGVAQLRRDTAHSAASDRPTDEDYARYIFIAATYRDRGYRDDDLQALPFCVVDPLFTTVLVEAERALADVAQQVGASGDRHRDRAAALSAAIVEHLWDEELGTFVALDARTNRSARLRTVGGLAPLLLDDLPAHVRNRLVETLTGPAFGLGRADVHGVPSYDLTAPDFDGHRYWRGPTWINTSWLLWRGLERAGERALRDHLARSMIDLVDAAGYREYFDPASGAGRGTHDFTWSAALALDVLAHLGSPQQAV
jgi:alkylhydroperoxidase family enzyme